MTSYEKALNEAHDAYFKPRPVMSGATQSISFHEGFKRGWKAAADLTAWKASQTNSTPPKGPLE